MTGRMQDRKSTKECCQTEHGLDGEICFRSEISFFCPEAVFLLSSLAIPLGATIILHPKRAQRNISQGKTTLVLSWSLSLSNAFCGACCRCCRSELNASPQVKVHMVDIVRRWLIILWAVEVCCSFGG